MALYEIKGEEIAIELPKVYTLPENKGCYYGQSHEHYIR